MILACPHCHVKVEKTDTTCRVCHRVMIRRCPSCAEDISVLATACKYCGEAVTPPAAVPPKSDVEFVGGVKYCAWEDPAKKGVFRRWWSTWKESQLSPGAFWQKMPTEGGHGKPLAYAWFLSAQALMLFLPFAWTIGAVIGIAADAPAWAYPAGAGVGLSLFPLTYLLCAVGTYLGALIWHLPLKLLGGRGSFQGTLRIIAYNTGTAVWGFVPGLGGIIQMIMQCVLNYHAYRAVHGLSKGRAIFAVALPFILTVVFVVAVVALILVLVANANGGRY